jgi:hypothetical protein
MKMTTDLLGKWMYASIGPMADVKDARSDEARTKETGVTSWKVLAKGTISRQYHDIRSSEVDVAPHSPVEIGFEKGSFSHASLSTIFFLTSGFRGPAHAV